MTPRELDELIGNKENYDLEFKAARNKFSIKNLHDYCAAIANEDGGHLLLGVNDEGGIVGTAVFGETWNELAHTLSEHLSIRVKVHEVLHEKGRVLVFGISRHYIGKPVEAKGGSYKYPIRDGESLVEMNADTYRGITSEIHEDFSAQIVSDVDISQLNQDFLFDYRRRWSIHTKNDTHLRRKFRDMLSDVGMARDGKLTYAALLLFGTESLLREYLPDAEIIFEWRNNVNDIPYGARESWRVGFMGMIDSVWSTIESRNTTFRYQEGFVQREIHAYDEKSIREAVTNAFAHRDYTIQGHSIIIKASPDKFYIENPGTFMKGVTVENIMEKSVYRNRLLAESLEKINIMERSSQGVDTIFMRAIEDGKGRPSYFVTTDPSIQLAIPAKLVDEDFVKFFEDAINKRGASLSAREILELEMIRTGEKRADLQFRDKFIELGLIEKYGRGRGQKFVLSHKYYSANGRAGEHTRITGLSREMRRATILQHLKKNHGVTNKELQDAMPDMKAEEISSLLKGMKKDDLITYEGSSPRWGHWKLKP